MGVVGENNTLDPEVKPVVEYESNADDNDDEEGGSGVYGRELST